MGPSSGQDAGLLWPQSRTGAQRAPNPGDVKLAAECEHPRSRDCLMHYVLHKYLLNEWDYRGCHGRGRSAAGAGGGGEDNDAWKTQRSGRSWMARPGPGDPRPAPQAGSRRAGLRSSAWARQRAPGGGGGGGAGTREPG
ncbi:ubiquitin-related modifier 1 isoform X1 [Prionailurus bengalensis]|uniref:ubiquitin-related modifier 1 isoform X1 n=1 Tax=Prionailurus bengalensis TaxID=37029 RepID=UPI001CA81FF1|nr:ubiquitin-related modifier 1 isoform X1 [Prionailurus bengalensis]